MADQIIKCRFLLQGPLHSNEPQAISLVAVQEFPSQLREQWHEAIIEHNVTSNEGCSSLQSFILDPNGAIEVKYDTMDSNTATPSADYVTLSAALAVLEVDEQVANLNPAGAIEVLHRMRQLGERIPLPGILAFNSFVLAATLHQASKSFLLPNPRRRALTGDHSPPSRSSSLRAHERHL